ncbi:hypothetical protein K1T71_000968 [Dendrolimus kikuchii]|uniref:Uncharacterized protein n=1 Tax=Dendrolimus kikuchii TaxID=765133 RepID=A0ACC1DHS5_9NEOP|nr:hypothetical protein K1T71_000968 [Dendrolimus kikuchii]
MIQNVIEELTGIWEIAIYRNQGVNLIHSKTIFGLNYSETICKIEVNVKKRILPAPVTTYTLISLLVIAVVAIITETVFLILYIKKAKNLSSTGKYGLEDEADTVRYSKTPTQRKDLSDDRESNLYECLENIRTSDENMLIRTTGPPLPPLPSPEVKMKLLGSSSVNSTLEKPAKNIKGRPPLPSPKTRPRIPSPVRRRCDSDGDETYEPPPNYRKSYTLPPRGLDALDKKALIDAIMAKKFQAPIPARPGLDQSNTIEKKVKNRPPLGVPAKHKLPDLHQKTSSSKKNLIDCAKPIAKIPPPILAVKNKSQNNTESELATVLKRRRNVSEEEPEQVEPLRNIPGPSTLRKPPIKKAEFPPQPPKSSKKPKNIPTPVQVPDTPIEDTPDPISDVDWTYEPLKQYNIYNI